MYNTKYKSQNSNHYNRGRNSGSSRRQKPLRANVYQANSNSSSSNYRRLMNNDASSQNKKPEDIPGTVTGKASWNNVPNKRLLVGTFLCAVVGTLRSRFCVPDTVLDVPDIIWNILPNNIWHIFLISDL